ncbi:hypothetical protein PR202_ga17797 [Eleusine coracana subsp. coracana]|uniref:Glabrous enhancer-binding protein-like DBD domain-containing protein n=1 Tax=Eleusine coracana subsp. coracana TaxID=191504 RepID=A0AAV5CR09_ELECO|nr:hypothetical protein PR202_ga17550 [Eleusine coracana subsp. coracana]GJN00605.1 hypothetical protein PR202_ga17797 [Eleusine coracana subsp. coracana]
MPSKRPSSHAMDEAAAAAARLDAATPRAKSRSSKSRARDRRRSPNPNPNSSRKRAPELPTVSASRKSDRKPKATAAAAAAAAAPPSSARGSGAAQKLWSDADEVALLSGAVAFKKDKSGIAPRLPDMGEFYEYVRDSIAPHLDQSKVYYKLKRLKSKFQRTAPGATSTPHDGLVRDLSADLWGAELAYPGEDGERPLEEGADVEEAEEGVNATQEPGRMPIVRELLGEHWRLNGQALSGVSLEKGLSLVGPDEAEKTEAKWRRQLEADMRMQMRWHDLGKEVCLAHGRHQRPGAIAGV